MNTQGLGTRLGRYLHASLELNVVTITYVCALTDCWTVNYTFEHQYVTSDSLLLSQSVTADSLLLSQFVSYDDYCSTNECATVLFAYNPKKKPAATFGVYCSLLNWALLWTVKITSQTPDAFKWLIMIRNYHRKYCNTDTANSEH